MNENEISAFFGRGIPGCLFPGMIYKSTLKSHMVGKKEEDKVAQNGKK